MVAAFFGKARDASGIFDRLNIAKLEIDRNKNNHRDREDKDNNRSEYKTSYKKHLNQHNVIYINFSEIPAMCTSYQEYIKRILEGIAIDLQQEYPEIGDRSNNLSVWDSLNMIFQITGDKFVFVIDEWDALFHMPFVSEYDKKDYILFLRTLLKDKAYIELVYMTGVLPIAKYSSGSDLNMFHEYDMATKPRFSEYFGFDDKEVDKLFDIYQQYTKKCRIIREDLTAWYDGYYTAEGKRLYNPKSIVCALFDNTIGNYWTSSGPYDEIFYYIRNNIDDVKEDIALLVSGEHIEAKLEGYSASNQELHNKNQIYSAMVVYGLLTYDQESYEIFIPNRELMEKYKELLMFNEDMGYVHRLAKESKRMLKATLDGDTKTMAEILQYAHNTESPILDYNSEIELSAIVNLVYLAARDKYRVEREDKAGKGYVDFIFYPEKKNADAIILELKVDHTPEEAIKQIKEKEYNLRFYGKLGEKIKYKGRILAVGITYDKDTKTHRCKVEEL